MVRQQTFSSEARVSSGWRDEHGREAQKNPESVASSPAFTLERQWWGDTDGRGTLCVRVSEVKGNRICHLKTCLFGIRIILGWLLLINTRHGRISEYWVEVTLLKQTFTLMRDISICKMSPSLSRRGQWLNLQELLSVEKATDLNLHHHTVFTELCPRHSVPHLAFLPTNIFFILSWRWYLRGCFGPFQRVPQFFVYFACIRSYTCY